MTNGREWGEFFDVVDAEAEAKPVSTEEQREAARRRFAKSDPLVLAALNLVAALTSDPMFYRARARVLFAVQDMEEVLGLRQPPNVGVDD